MLRLAVTLAALAIGGSLLDGDAAAGKRKGGKRGRVVRVERSRVGSAGTLRTCALNGANMAVCYGRAPEVGDRGPIVDTTTMYGEARITQVTPTPDSCGNITSWNVTFEAASAAVSALSYGPSLFLDFAATAQARTLPLSGQVPVSSKQGETMYVTVDADGDLDPDVYISAYTCDTAANVVPWGQGQIGYCMGYWVNGSKGWDLLRTDVVRSC